MKFYIRVTETHTNPKNRLQEECRARTIEDFDGVLCADESALKEQQVKILELKHVLELKHNRCKPLRLSERLFKEEPLRYAIWDVGTIEFLPVKKEVPHA